MLRVQGVEVGYGDIQVLWDIDLEVKIGELVALVGANGAGKTTLIKTISGLLTPYRGKILWGEQDISKARPSERVALGIIQVPEGRKLFAGMTVQQNLLVGAFLIRDKRLREKNLEMVYHLFPEIKDRRHQLAGTLSGGQQQMVAIGRALMGSPRILLIDELSLGLAPVVVDRIAEALVQIRNSYDIGMLIVEQDVQLALELCDRGIVLESGKVVLEGPAAELLADEGIREAYLGL